MVNTITMITVLLTILSSSLAESDYCKFTAKHTMCQYQGSGPACNGQPLSRGVSEAEKATILEVHNRYRAKIARVRRDEVVPGLNLLQLI